jgi:heterodisulfide reductase subunit B
MKYIFYPGCAMQRSARPYLDSLRAVQEALSMELHEVEDWNCCGATEYMSIWRIPAFALVGRNLALASEQANGSATLLAACSACYLNLAKTDHYMQEDPQLDQQVNAALTAGGLRYEAGSIEVRHLLDVILNDIGIERICQQVTRPLTGLRVAAYYGCLVVRPDHDHRWDSTEYPSSLESLMSALGAEVVDFPLKTHCCGGHMTQISPPTAYELIRRLAHGAAEYEADVLVTVCPMCQLNLDAYQVEMNKHFKTDYEIPILFVTQLLGLALGRSPAELGLGREFIDSGPALAKIGIEPEEQPPTQRGKKPKLEGLPMPPPLEGEPR